jgi:hypothetical protein
MTGFVRLTRSRSGSLPVLILASHRFTGLEALPAGPVRDPSVRQS